jgi:cytochrome c-type biogenesis protein CcmH
MKLKLLIILLFLFSTASHAADQDIYHFTSAADAARFQSLTKEIRCVVCQNQNIADSNAPLANDLREKIYKMVLDHQSNDEIENYLVKRYGEFILLNPRLNKLTIALWTFPFLGILFIFYLLYRLFQRQNAKGSS